MSKAIEVVPYNSNWPIIFEEEAVLMQSTLQDNCLEIHHVGSTSVPGLCAKPKIDIIAVVKNGNASIASLEKAGFVYKGEWNIPFKFGFTKRGVHDINLHVFEENHPEIELNIVFRNHLRSHPESMHQYATIKETLLQDETSYKKQTGQLFSGYNLGKDAFIRNVLIEEGYTRHRFLKVTHYQEWAAYHRIRKEQIFDPINVIYDSNHPTIHAKNHYHFILCYGMEIATVGHIEFLNETEAALRSLATDLPFQSMGYGKEMMILLEKWLKSKSIQMLKIHVRLSAETFYRSLGYQDCPFDDPCISEHHIDLAKLIK